MSPKINFPNKKLVIKCPIILYKSGNLISEQKFAYFQISIDSKLTTYY